MSSTSSPIPDHFPPGNLQVRDSTDSADSSDKRRSTEKRDPLAPKNFSRPFQQHVMVARGWNEGESRLIENNTGALFACSEWVVEISAVPQQLLDF